MRENACSVDDLDPAALLGQNKRHLRATEYNGSHRRVSSLTTRISLSIVSSRNTPGSTLLGWHS